VIVWEDTAKLKSVEEVPIFKGYNDLIKQIACYADGWYKALNGNLYYSTKIIVDEWNKTHKRKIISVNFDFGKKEYSCHYMGNTNSDIVEKSTISEQNNYYVGHRKKIFSEEKFLELCENYFSDGMSKNAIAKKFKVDEKTIRNYLKR